MFLVSVVGIIACLVCFPFLGFGDGFNYRQFAGTTIVVHFPVHDYHDALIKIIPEFEALTGIKVIVDRMAYTDMRTKQLLEFTKPVNSYDLIVNVGPIVKTEYAVAGYLQVLDPLLEREDLRWPGWDINDFAEPLLIAQGIVCLDCRGKAVYLGGGPGTNTVLVGVPASAEVNVFVYRKDLFEQYGLTPPKTLQEVLEISKFFYENVPGVYGLTMRGAAGHQAVHAFLNFAGIRGAKLFSEDWEPLFLSQPVLDVLYFMRDVAKYGPPGIPSFGPGENNNAFLQGIAAMYLDHSRIASYIRDPAQSRILGKVEYCDLPTWEGVERPLYYAETGGFGVYIPANAAHKEAAFLFLQWMTSREVYKKLALDYGIQLVDRLSILNDPELQAIFPEYTIFAKLVEHADPDWRPVIPEWPTISMQYFGVAVNDVITGKKTPEEAMAEIIEPVMKILREAGYIK